MFGALNVPRQLDDKEFGETKTTWRLRREFAETPANVPKNCMKELRKTAIQ